MKMLVLVLAAVLIAGCKQQTVSVIKFTDIQSRRTYRSVGQPSVLPSGAVSFVDEGTGKAVTIQSWEAEDDAGRYYVVKPVTNFMTGRQEYQLVPGGGPAPATKKTGSTRDSDQMWK